MIRIPQAGINPKISVYKYLILLCPLLISIQAAGQNEITFKVPLKKNVPSRMYNKAAIAELAEINGEAFAKSIEPRVISANVKSQHPFRVIFEDANKNGIYDEVGVDLIAISKPGEDSVFIHESVSCNYIAPVTILKVLEKYYKFELITKNQDYLIITECLYCERAKNFEPTIKLVDALPDLDVELIDGRHLNLKDLIDANKDYTYIEVWGAWCKPCLNIIPELKATYDKYKNKITMVSLNFIDSKEDVIKFVKEHDMNWINGFSSKSINSELLLLGFPYGILFDKKGNLIDSHVDVFELKRILSKEK